MTIASLVDGRRHDAPGGPSRRDFLTVTAAAWAGVGAAATLWPLVEQMSPDASTRSLATVEVDLAGIAPGQAVTVMWRGKPVFVRHRTVDEIAAARAVPVAALPDGRARATGRADALSAADGNRTREGHAQWLVVVGVCTHFGCVPQGQCMTEKRGSYGGWFCSCHGSEYDTSGRIRQGPAPENLSVPPYWFVSDSRIEIGRLEKGGDVI